MRGYSKFCMTKEVYNGICNEILISLKWSILHYGRLKCVTNDRASVLRTDERIDKNLYDIFSNIYFSVIWKKANVEKF